MHFRTGLYRGGLGEGPEVPGLHAEYAGVQEHHRVHGLVLRLRRDLPAIREIGQERLDRLRTQLARVAVPVEAEEATDPVDVVALGGQGVVVCPQDLTAFLQERRLGGHDCFSDR